MSSATKVANWGFSKCRILVAKPGETFRLGRELNVRALEACDPFAESAVTYLIETRAGNIFHSGDTNYFEKLKEIGSKFDVDVALLNFGKQVTGVEKQYYMSAKQVADAARDLRAKVVVPIHWDLWADFGDDPKSVAPQLKLVRPESILKILNVGEKFELVKTQRPSNSQSNL
jgi:L-ascorbate 6-phosphate lactonase